MCRTIFCFAGLMGAMFIGSHKSADAQAKLRLLMADCQGRSVVKLPDMAGRVKEAVEEKLTALLADPNPKTETAPGAATYTLAGRYAVEEARKRLSEGDQPEAQTSAAARLSAWLRLADLVRADALVDVNYSVVSLKPTGVRLSLTMDFVDVITSRRMALAHATVEDMQGHVPLDAALEEVCRYLLRSPLTRAPIHERTGKKVTLPLGTINSVHVGDEFTVVRQENGILHDVGRVIVEKVTSSEATARISKEVDGAVVPGTICTLITDRVYGAH